LKNFTREAFTMIELVFVIVVLGILAAVAIPRFSATRTDAQISKGRADVASIRSAIITERQSRLITGDSQFIAAGVGSGKLDGSATELFSGVLTYPVIASNSDGHWHTRASSDATSSTVKYKIGTTDVVFTYTRSTGVFTCDRATTYCPELID